MRSVVMAYPYVPESAIAAVEKVLRSRFVGQGPVVDRFERAFEDKFHLPAGSAIAVNSGTSALELAYDLMGLGIEDEIITTPLTCLSYYSPVLMANGSTKPIGQIVNQKITEEVLSLNQESGQLEPQRITGWTKVPSKDVTWFRLRCKNGIGSRSGEGKRGIWITGDHKVLTKRGYIRIDSLIENDEVATRQRCLNPKQREVVVGMMLGDGCVRRITKGNSRFQIIHSTAQREWFNLECRALMGMGYKVYERVARKQSSPSCLAETLSGFEWTKFRNEWYPKGKKVVPDNIELTPLTLATWYMDDGSLTDSNGAIFCTEGFDREAIWRLFWKLVDLGFKPRIYPAKGSLRIGLGNGNSDEYQSAMKLFSMIGAYVPPSMRYKLPADAPEYDPSLWNLGDAGVSYDIPIVVKKDPPKHEKLSYVYCIEVEENHNFISSDIVLSNCTATNIPLVRRGCDLVFADVDRKTLNINPLFPMKECRRAKAIVNVHLHGVQSDVAPVLSIKTIDDAAQALGIYRGAQFTAYSFQAIKHITTGSGGMLVCANPDDAKEARLRRWFGIDRELKLSNNWQPFKQRKILFDIEYPGYQFQMTDIQAAMGLAGLEEYDEILAHRKAIFAIYKDASLPMVDGEVNKYGYACLLVENRDDFCATLAKAGIETNVMQVRNDRYKIFEPFRTPMPNMDWVEDRYICIPLHNRMTMDDARYVADVAGKAWK